MKRLLLAACALALVAGAESFARADYMQTCQQCQTQRPHHHGHRQAQAQACPPEKCSPFASLLNCLGLGNRQTQMAAPPMQGPTVAYPYYTTRAPRDFLDPNPRSIGP